jgi:hypothetical protein
MSEQEKQESQKTVVAFAAGLLIGGLLVWIFGGSPKTEEITQEKTGSETTEEVTNTTGSDDVTSEVKTVEKPALVTGAGKIEIDEVKAGKTVVLKSATFPTDEGWIGVRDYANGQPAGLLGVARYSNEQALVPETVVLQRAMVAGNSYAIVFYSESGDRVFSLADDKQLDGAFATFTAK